MRCLCGSYAINPHSPGREPDVDPHLCDVCYWQARAAAYRKTSMDIYCDWDNLYRAALKHGWSPKHSPLSMAEYVAEVLATAPKLEGHCSDDT